MSMEKFSNVVKKIAAHCLTTLFSRYSTKLYAGRVFLLLKYIIIKLTPENWNVLPSRTLLRLKVFKFLLYLKIILNIRCDNLLAKGLIFSLCRIAVVFSMCLIKRYSKFLFFSILHKSIIFSKDLSLSESKVITVFQNCLLSTRSLSFKGTLMQIWKSPYMF